MKLSSVLLAAPSLLGVAAAALLAPSAALLTAGPAAAYAAPAATAVQTIDRGRFTVEVSGQGPDVIVIPGLASARGVYDPLMPHLAGYRVHRVQIAGFAGLPAGPNAEGPVVQPFIDALAAYITEAKLKKPAVIGHSMGGFSGLVLAQQHPDLVSRVMIVDAASFISAMGNPAATAEASRPGAEAFKGQLAGMSDEQFAAGQPGTAAFMMKSVKDRPSMIDWTIHTDRRVMAQAVYDIMTSDARPGLVAMTTPVTVLYAWDEAMSRPGREVTPQAMDQMYAGLYAGLPGVKLVRIDASYHFIMFDQPERFAAEVKTFLE